MDAHLTSTHGDGPARMPNVSANPNTSKSMRTGASQSNLVMNFQLRERRNWLIHMLYVRKDFQACEQTIDSTLKETNGMCEYALYTQALIRRQQGKVNDSLQLFQAATCLSPHNVSNLKQVGRSLYLLGKHKAAKDLYDEAEKAASDDWEISHTKGQCYTFLREYDMAIEAFLRANQTQRHDFTYLQLGKVHSMREDFNQAVAIYKEALEFSPENADILTTLGLLHLRLGENGKAFELLGTALTLDPKSPKTILAAGSIIQDHQDFDVALIKYRVAAVVTPNSAQLWNNVGLCFFGKQKLVAAVACLKRALYLDPFEWIISYNLGVVHLATGQYASAFHFLSTSINLKPDFPSSYAYLAIALAKVDDYSNAKAAYSKAVEMEVDHGTHLNFALTAWHFGDTETAIQQFSEFERLFSSLDPEAQAGDPDVTNQRALLSSAIAMRQGGGA